MIIVKKNKFLKFSSGYLLFSIAYFPWLICWMLTSSYYKDLLHPYGIINIWKYLGAIFLIIKILIDKISNKIILFFKIALIFLGAIVSSGNDNAGFVFYSIILMIAASNLDIKWIVKETMYCQIVTLFLTVVSSLIGIIPNDQGISYAGGIVRYRECLGYTYTTFAPNFLLSIAIEWLYIYQSRSKKKLVIYAALIMMVNLFFYSKTETRTSVILITLVVVVKVFKVLSSKNIHIIKNNYIIKNIFMVMAIASIGVSFFYNPAIKWMLILNNLLSQRLRFAKEGFQKWGVTLFGTPVIWNSDAVEYNYIDSSYVNILICYGIILFFIVIIGFNITTHYAYYQGDKNLEWALVFWAIRAFIDPQLYLLWFNPFMFYSSIAIIKQFNNRKEKLSSRVSTKNVIDYMRV